jgi:hypothetical protein
VTAPAAVITRGAPPTPAEAAALAAAVAQLLEQERRRAAAPGDAMPAAYRSAWRQAGIREAHAAREVR